MNNKEIKLTGSAYIDRDLKIDNDYTIGLNVSCYATGQKSNQNGEFTDVYKLKPTGAVLISKDLGDSSIKGMSKNSSSKRLRSALYYKHGELGIGEDFEPWYERIMGLIMIKLDDII